MQKTTIAFVDDHKLFRAGLASVINEFRHFEVTLQADNGHHFIKQLRADNLPEIVLLDISMPVMNGYDTTVWLQQYQPQVKIVAVSQIDEDYALTRMIALGACAFVLKDEEPEVLENCLEDVRRSGFSFAGILGLSVKQALRSKTDTLDVRLSDLEQRFLQRCITADCYKQIAGELQLTYKQVDHLSSRLFKRFNVVSRHELAVFAVRNGLTLPPPPLMR